jgi:signal transduction histidine kinase
VIGIPFLILGLLIALSAIFGARVAERSGGAVGMFVLSPFHPATWRAGLAILLGFVVETVAVVVVIAGFSAGASLLFFGIGIVIIGLTIEVARLVAGLERRRASLADPRPLISHAYRPYGEGLKSLVLAIFADAARWLDVAYVFIAFPLTFLEASAVLVLWSIAIGLLSVPFWVVASGGLTVSGDAAVAQWLGIGVAFLIGVLMTPVAAIVSQGLMRLHRQVISGLLCDSERHQLERRVETLEGSRRAVIDAEASELRRIERDLHDGAQQRLVALTMDLGLAADRLETDPAGARQLVLGAQDQARQALAELRDLVRGIAPAILLDRGLVAALGALAGRSPVPTTVESELPEGSRPSDAIERAAYYVVAEAMANVAKHASASRCRIRCRLDGPALLVEVEDDGTGGARIVPGGGLAGLAGRVEALDGTLTVASPEGGPTIIRAAFPNAIAARTDAPLAPPGAAVAPTGVPGEADPSPTREPPQPPVPAAPTQGPVSGWRGPGAPGR